MSAKGKKKNGRTPDTPPTKLPPINPSSAGKKTDETQCKTAASALDHSLSYQAENIQPPTREQLAEFKRLWEGIYSIIPRMEEKMGKNEISEETKALMDSCKQNYKPFMNFLKYTQGAYHVLVAQQSPAMENDAASGNTGSSPSNYFDNKIVAKLKPSDKNSFPEHYSRQDGICKNREHAEKFKRLDIVEQEKLTLEARIEKLMEEKKDLEKSNLQFEELVKSQTEEIKFHKERIKLLQSEVDELSDRLAAEMNKKLAGDESNLENISIKNRPMNVAENYKQFCSQEWFEAKVLLDKTYKDSDEYEKLMFLNDMICLTGSYAEDTHREVISNIDKTLAGIHNPFSFLDSTSSKQQPDKSGQGKSDSKGRMMSPHSRAKDDAPQTKAKDARAQDPPVSTELQKIVADELRKQDTAKICQQFYEITRKRIDSHVKEQTKKQAKNTNYLRLWDKVYKKDKFIAFLQKAAEISWQMVLQRPPMRFECDDLNKIYMGQDYQDINWGSEPPGKDTIVVCYGYPMLYHGSKFMAKGKVFLKKKK